MSIVDPAFIASSNWPRSRIGEPAWQVAYFFPPQGKWGESNYLALDRGGGRLVELVEGRLEVLSMPTWLHQVLVKFLLYRLDRHVTDRKLGTVLCAPLPVHLGQDHYREPDIVFMRPHRVAGRQYPELADLLMEVVSADPESRRRDLEEKRRDYALAGIPEYWIVEPETKTVTVLALEDKQYRIHGEFKAGDVASSVLLPGFSIDVIELFASAQPS